MLHRLSLRRERTRWSASTARNILDFGTRLEKILSFMQINNIQFAYEYFYPGRRSARRSDTCSIIDTSKKDLLYSMANSFIDIELSKHNGMNSIIKEKSLAPAGNLIVTPCAPSR
jgi:hypothetical protein